MLYRSQKTILKWWDIGGRSLTKWSVEWGIWKLFQIIVPEVPEEWEQAPCVWDYVQHTLSADFSVFHHFFLSAVWCGFLFLLWAEFSGLNIKQITADYCFHVMHARLQRPYQTESILRNDLTLLKCYFVEQQMWNLFLRHWQHLCLDRLLGNRWTSLLNIWTNPVLIHYLVWQWLQFVDLFLR